MFVRVLEIAERIRVDSIGGGHFLPFEFHLNLVFAFNESPQR